jgi:hypothetical protein
MCQGDSSASVGVTVVQLWRACQKEQYSNEWNPIDAATLSVS